MEKQRHELRQLVQGALKHATRELYRQQTTRHGLHRSGRSVDASFPLELLEDHRMDEREPVDELKRERQLTIVRRQIREVVRKPCHHELVMRRLMRGECIAALAAELGYSPSSARCLVNRAEYGLGLRS